MKFKKWKTNENMNIKRRKSIETHRVVYFWVVFSEKRAQNKIIPIHLKSKQEIAREEISPSAFLLHSLSPVSQWDRTSPAFWQLQENWLRHLSHSSQNWIQSSSLPGHEATYPVFSYPKVNAKAAKCGLNFSPHHHTRPPFKAQGR